MDASSSSKLSHMPTQARKPTNESFTNTSQNMKSQNQTTGKGSNENYADTLNNMMQSNGMNGKIKLITSSEITTKLTHPLPNGTQHASSNRPNESTNKIQLAVYSPPMV
jgi:hypothetical protein